MNENLLFHRTLKEASRRDPNELGKTVYSDQDILEKISYNINSHGYRSEEFNKNNEVVVLGCSQTYGSGMHNELTWPEFFCNFTNQKYSRLAIPGDSIGAQVYKAFKYFEEVGNPKLVIGLFPLYRLEYISVPGKFEGDSPRNGAQRSKLSVGIAFFYQQYITKISKIPHNPEYVIPKEFVVFYNFMFIKMLEQYCESHNIKFIWSIYDSKEDKKAMEFSTYNILKNYLNTLDLLQQPDDQPQSHLSNCPISSQKEYCGKFSGHKLYYWAADTVSEKQLGHWGIHVNHHIAKLFADKYMEIKND